MEEACVDRASIGIDVSADTPEIYMVSSGIETTDHYRAIWREAVFNGLTQEETEIIGTYNKAVFATTPVFLVGQMGVSWNFIVYYPMYHLFTAMKSAYFGKSTVSFPYYFACIGASGILFFAVWRVMTREMTKEG